jgi:Tol biopolymer transport system component
MNPDGSNPTRLTTKPATSSYVYDGQPRWSPDGRQIAFQSFGRGNNGGRSLFVMNADGSNLHEVVFDFSGVIGFGELGAFDWAPDGAGFIFEAGVHASVGMGKLTTNIFTAQVDGGPPVRLTSDTEVLNATPRWSPDGKTIAFVSDVHDGAGKKIQLMTADGGNRRTIAGGYSPSWSPDGSKILFIGPMVSCRGYPCFQLNTVKPDGSGLTQVTKAAAMYEDPRYSPDGAKILFGKSSRTAYYTVAEIFVMDADGNNEINISNRLTTTNVAEHSPDWQTLSGPITDPPPSTLGLSDKSFIATTPTAQIVIKRDGNLNQAVSCDYQIRVGEITGGLPRGTVSFARGETSRTIPFAPMSETGAYEIVLFNNAGNATFVGGITRATITFAIPKNTPEMEK